jgi:hypothetical protein
VEAETGFEKKMRVEDANSPPFANGAKDGATENSKARARLPPESEVNCF